MAFFDDCIKSKKILKFIIVIVICEKNDLKISHSFSIFQFFI